MCVLFLDFFHSSTFRRLAKSHREIFESLFRYDSLLIVEYIQLYYYKWLLL